jgi:hypothetical protein
MGSHGQDGHGELPEEIRKKLIQMQQDGVEGQGLRRTLGEMQEVVSGEFPSGKLNPDDQGALMVAFGVDRGKVILAFPKPIDWVALEPEQARESAELLLERARDCDGIEAHVRRVTTEEG